MEIVVISVNGERGFLIDRGEWRTSVWDSWSWAKFSRSPGKYPARPEGNNGMQNWPVGGIYERAAWISEENHRAHEATMPLFSQSDSFGNWGGWVKRWRGVPYNRPVCGRIDYVITNSQGPETTELHNGASDPHKRKLRNKIKENKNVQNQIKIPTTYNVHGCMGF